jgi:hypothetical protein
MYRPSCPRKCLQGTFLLRLGLQQRLQRLLSGPPPPSATQAAELRAGFRRLTGYEPDEEECRSNDGHVASSNALKNGRPLAPASDMSGVMGQTYKVMAITSVSQGELAGFVPDERLDC